MNRMKEKVVVVTGGSNGIGRATSLAFAQEGAKVVIADVDEEGGKQTEFLIQEAGGEALYVNTDVTSETEVQKTMNIAVTQFGHLDCAFNNAGIAGKSDYITSLTEETWDRVNAVNLKGIWLCMKHELRHMLKQGRGTIVNTSSLGGLTVIRPLRAAYSASKFGIIGLTKAAALEYAGKGIRINVICPGMIMTSMTTDAIRELGPDHPHSKHYTLLKEAGFQGTPKDVAEAVIWLSSSDSSFINGQTLVIDGGLHAGMQFSRLLELNQRLKLFV